MRKTMLFVAALIVATTSGLAHAANLVEFRDTNNVFAVSIATPSNNLVGANLDAAAVNRNLLPNARLDSSSVTLQGNAFNGAAQLVQLNGSTQLPAVSGVNVTALNASQLASGTIPAARNDSSSVTLQGNSFNAASKLVQLDSSTRLPAVDGSLLVNLSTVAMPFNGGTVSGQVTVLSSVSLLGSPTSLYASGNVGIGTTNPATALDMGSSGDITSNSNHGLLSSIGNGSLFVRDAETGAHFFAATGLTVALGDAATASAFVSANGVRISTTSSFTIVNPLDVSGGEAIGSYAGVNTAPFNGLIVSGKVGIGNTNPSTPLDVTGAIHGTSSVTASAFFGDGGSVTNVAAVSVPAAGVQAGSLGGSVIASSIAAAAVGTTQLASQAVTAAKIANNTITDTQVSNGTFTNVNIPAANINAGTLGASVIASSVAATAVASGSYGSATQVGTFTVGVDGRLSAASSVTVTPAAASVAAGTFSGSFTFGSALIVNGLLEEGALSAASIRTLACATNCTVFNTDDHDIYTSTGTAAGSWRNSRTGVAP